MSQLNNAGKKHYSYLLRLWRRDQEKPAQWLASLEDPQTSERRSFSNLDSLFAFLVEQTRAQELPPKAAPMQNRDEKP